MPRILEIAKKFVRTHNFDATISFRHCAIVAKGGKILGVGYNRHGWSSRQAGKYCKLKMSNGGCTVHAEVSALLQVSNRENVKGSNIYVVRITRAGMLANSEPCPMCAEILMEHGVKKAFFTVSANEKAHGELSF